MSCAHTGHFSHNSPHWRGLSASLRISTKSFTISKVLGTVALCVALILVLSEAVNDDNINKIKMKRPFFLGPLMPSRPCYDNWSMPGYIWYGPRSREIRWIPYSQFDRLQFNDTDSFEPEHHYEAFKNPSLPESLAQTTQYSELFRTKASRMANQETLRFMRNKHVISLGSSLDRNGVIGFCQTHEGCQTLDLGRHRAARYHWPEFNFTLSYWFHFGLHESDWHHGDDDPANGLTFEERLEKVFRPLKEKYGRPNMVIFSTAGLWDLYYTRGLDQKHVPANQAERVMVDPLTPNQLLWHRTRFIEVVNLVKAEFPDTPLFYRTTTYPKATVVRNDNRAIAVFQINQSARSLMSQLKVPLFNWADLIQGNHEYLDSVHFKLDSKPTWLWGEQMLWHLEYVSDSARDTSCWLYNR